MICLIKRVSCDLCHVHLLAQSTYQLQLIQIIHILISIATLFWKGKSLHDWLVIWINRNFCIKDRALICSCNFVFWQCFFCVLCSQQWRSIKRKLCSLFVQSFFEVYIHVKSCNINFSLDCSEHVLSFQSINCEWK